jgi:predicted nucleotidyltransferase
MKGERIKYGNDMYANIGPGQYYIDSLNPKNKQKLRSLSEHHASSAFRSESVRSFFDNIKYETNL